jgi:hypothetical protein
MERYFVAITEQNKVYGAADCNGRQVAWTFDDHNYVMSFIRDFKYYWPIEDNKVVNYNNKDIDSLDEFLEQNGYYPVINPKVKVYFTDDNLFFPGISEGEENEGEDL